MEALILILGHVAGDYSAQSDYMALNKHKCAGALLRHCAWYTVVVSIALHLIGAANIYTVGAVFISHAIIDCRDWPIPWTSYPPTRILTDQAAHVAVLVALAVWVVGM